LDKKIKSGGNAAMLSVGEKVMVIYSFEVSEYINQKNGSLGSV
jgi:hypothetical protein